jgi:hypothetical protein
MKSRSDNNEGYLMTAEKFTKLSILKTHLVRCIHFGGSVTALYSIQKNCTIVSVLQLE